MPKNVTAEDIDIGHRVRALRLGRGMSQTALADKLGVTFQQVQKYEKGVNRVAGGRLVKIANLFGVKVAALVGDGDSETSRANEPYLMLSQSRDGLRLTRSFTAIAGRKTRSLIVDLIESIATDQKNSRPSKGG